MNKVITINLNGTAHQLEEAGYAALHAYLETATARLQSNPDREEILSDIERAIADKFRALLSSHKTVVETKEVAAVIAEMGPIEADPVEGTEPGASSTGAKTSASSPGTGGEERPPGEERTPRRLYRIHEGEMLCGVCNGIAAYINIDPTFVRLAFVLLTMAFGTGVMVYVVLAIVIPEARSPEEKAAAAGAPSTAQEFIRRAKAGYYEAIKGIPDRQKKYRAWNRRFRREMRAHRNQWRQHWYGPWAEPAPFHAGMGFTLPFLSMLQGALTILWICALISLLHTRAVFGLELPAKLPVWGAAILLFIGYGILTAPLKAARHACYWGVGKSSWARPFMILLDALIWVAVVAVLLCLAVHFYPELREAVRNFPAVAHETADSIRDWWRGM